MPDNWWDSEFYKRIQELENENEELRENQIAGRCETCRSANVGGSLCDAWDDERRKCSDTEPMGYCHRWEARQMINNDPMTMTDEEMVTEVANLHEKCTEQTGLISVLKLTVDMLERENDELREALRDVLTYHEDEPWVPAWRLLGVQREEF